MPAPKPLPPVVALILNVRMLQEQRSCLNLLYIFKSDKGIRYEEHPLTKLMIERSFKGQPHEVQELLARFHDDDIRFEANVMKKQRSLSGITTAAVLERKVTRYLMERVESLSKHSEQLRFYHRIKNPQTGNMLTAPCKLHGTGPALSFEVVRDTNGLSAMPVFMLSNERLDNSGLRREKFLLIREHDYYLLKYKDFLALEWLQQRNAASYASDEALFAEEIIARLEETHTVERNGLLAKNEIKADAVSCIYVSEIGNSMLMLTPKWKYEGLVVDGPYQAIHKTTRNGIVYEIHRNRGQEDALTDLLAAQHPGFTNKLAAYQYLSFTEAGKKQWFLKAYQQFLEHNVEMIGLDMLQHFRYSPHAAVTEMQILDEEGNNILAQLKVSFGKETVGLRELQKQLLAGQHSILLSDNTIAVFTDEWLGQYSLILKHGAVKRKHELLIPRWLFLSLEEGNSRKTLSGNVKDEWLGKWKQWQQTDETVYPVPATFRATLRPYQQKGFEWLCLLAEAGAGACLADDMGLGKTLQTIAFLLKQQADMPGAKFLISCPASLIYNWLRELEKFAPALQPHIYLGPGRSLNSFDEVKADILICSYGTLRADIEDLKLREWQCVVLDESHAIKNISSLTTRAIGLLQSESRICLSGTPVMNNTFDLYAQLGFLLPGLLGSQEFFRKEYALPIDRDQNKTQMAALQQLTGPFILRRTKAQVAPDLPEKTESVLWCNMGDEQRQVYEAVKEQIRDSIYLGIKDKGLAQSKLSILDGIMKLRQVCASPALLNDYRDHPASVKTELLLEEIAQLKDSKALVFSQFKGMLHLIAAACSKRHIPFYHFDGDTPVARRNELVVQFQEEGNQTKLFLISLKSGNAGLNLTAADYVFLVDPWWNTAVQQQAIDRTHRIGQTKSVFAYKMICKDTIEEKILALQQQKQILSDELINDDGGFIKQLSEDDVTYLFS